MGSYLDRQYESPKAIERTLETHEDVKKELGRIADERANNKALHLTPDGVIGDHRSETQIVRDEESFRRSNIHDIPVDE